MKTTLNRTSTTTLPYSAVQEKAQAKARLTYIDNLRVLMTLLVIMVHTAITYGAAGSWFSSDPNPEPLSSALLTLFNATCQSFFMGFFFFLSGYFVPGSIDRKGFAWFWKDRLLRLGIPLLVFSTLLGKIPLYLDGLYFHRTDLSFWEYSARYFVDTFDSGPTWFLFALLVLSAGYSLGRVLLPNVKPSNLLQPSPRTLVVFALVMAVLMFVTCQVWPIGEFYRTLGFVYLQPAFFPQYIMMFAAGILAYRCNWLQGLTTAGQGIWKWAAIACLVIMPIAFVLGGAASGDISAFLTGFGWQAIFLNVWVGFSCVSLSLTLMGLFARYFNTASSLQTYISNHTYAAYILHPLVLVSITLAMTTLALPNLLKFALAATLATTISYLLAYMVRSLPGAKQIL